MSFLDGIKSSMKFDEMAAGAASRMAAAKEFAAEKTAGVTAAASDNAAMKTAGGVLGGVMSKASGLAGGASSYLGSTSLGKYLPLGGGKRQSPIDIVTSEAVFDEALGDGKFTFNYRPMDCETMRNTGTMVEIDCSENANSAITANFLSEPYQLKLLQIKFGTEPMNGSEHLIGGVGYAGELHVVHMKSSYASLEQAAKHPDGLAILSVFLNESHDDNRALMPIINNLSCIQYMGEAIKLDNGLDLKSFIPEKREFWTYEGSVTVAPYPECAIWAVFRQSIPISTAQLDKLRQLHACAQADAEKSTEPKLAGQVRPPQQLNGRQVRSSFRSGGVVPELQQAGTA